MNNLEVKTIQVTTVQSMLICYMGKISVIARKLNVHRETVEGILKHNRSHVVVINKDGEFELMKGL